MTTAQKLAQRQQLTQSRLCIGIDPDERLLPAVLRRDPRPWKRFLQELIPATAPYACAFKLNLVFYLRLGLQGWHLLEDTLALIPPDILTILDGKWGDVPHTAAQAAQLCFEQLGVDAVTLNPLLGSDAAAPFLDYPDKLVFVLARTSNAGAAEFLTLPCRRGKPLYAHIVSSVLRWPRRAEVGFVVGATAPDDFAHIRRLAPQVWLLVPGIGTQGGNIATLMELNCEGPLVVNVGRAILYASDQADFAAAAACAAASFAQAVSLATGG